MPSSSSPSSSSLLTPDEEAMALLQSGPSPRDDALSPSKEDDKLSDESDYSSDSDELSEADVTDEIDAPSSPTMLNLRIKCNCADLPTDPPCRRNTSGEYLVSIPRPSTSSSSSAATAAPTVSTLKLAILAALFGPTTTGTSTTNASDRYLRLIVRGRLLAPDSAPLSNFGLDEDDVVHAVIAPAGVRGGQQATLARGVDLSGIGNGMGLTNTSGNGGGGSAGGGGGGGGRGSNNGGRGRRTRGVGINASGIVIPPSQRRSNADDESSSSSEDDLESGRSRRGFDRLRATGLSRDEIGAIRIYFRRQVDRFGTVRERNRRRLEREVELDRRQRRQLQREEGGGEDEEDEDEDNNGQDGESGADEADARESATTSQSSTAARDVRNDRLQLEDEWMAAQGPTSEFRLNLNANASRVLGQVAALRGSNAATATAAAAAAAGRLAFRGAANGAAPTAGPFASGPLGVGVGVGVGPGGISPWAVANARSTSLVGSDRDFVWGFLLGFFLGFVMLFWVWIPTVPHKQKLGLLTGLCFHLILKMRSDDGDGIVDDSYD